MTSIAGRFCCLLEELQASIESTSTHKQKATDDFM
jgi:hypothetical protein